VADRHRPDRRPYAPIAAGLALVTTAALAAVLSSPVPVTAAIGGWQTLRLALRGDHLVGQLGTVSVTATDAQFASGRIGLATSYATGWFDDILVEPSAPDILPPSTPGQPQVLSVVPGAVTITWPASTDNDRVAQYYVYQGDQFYSQYLARVVPDKLPADAATRPDGGADPLLGHRSRLGR
jgi:hypothetical protein